jgi:hypothetical protein
MLRPALLVLISIGYLALPARADFAQVDAYALATPQEKTADVGTLAAHLSAGAKTDLDKARVIYRWIAENVKYDADALFASRRIDGSPAAVLKTRSAVCEGYARLYKALADAMGLECEIVSGHAKGVGYAPGQPVPEASNHAWNAVKIDGRWRLVDSTWGAGHLDGRQFVSRFTEHYFLTPPEQMIFTHRPADDRWQLLDEPLTRAQYAELVYIRPAFFDYGLQIGNQRHGAVSCDGRARFEFAGPAEVVGFGTLTRDGSKDELPGATLVQRAGDKLSIDVACPEPGDYRFSLFLRKPGEKTYKAALEYRVAATGKADAFPETLEDFVRYEAQLEAPLSRTLKAGDEVEFRFRLTGAKAVGIHTNGRVIPLRATNGVYTGKVKVQRGDVSLVAKRTAGEGGRYDVLLRYTAK